MPETKEEYPASPMHRHLKEVVWYQLAREPSPTGREDGKLHRLKWLFETKDFPCGACHRADNVKFMVLPTGVYRSCESEGFTEKIEPIDEGEFGSEATLLEDTICTNEEALAVIKMYHQERIFLDPDTRVFLPEYRLPRPYSKKPPTKKADK